MTARQALFALVAGTCMALAAPAAGLAQVGTTRPGAPPGPGQAVPAPGGGTFRPADPLPSTIPAPPPAPQVQPQPAPIIPPPGASGTCNCLRPDCGGDCKAMCAPQCMGR